MTSCQPLLTLPYATLHGSSIHSQWTQTIWDCSVFDLEGGCNARHDLNILQHSVDPHRDFWRGQLTKHTAAEVGTQGPTQLPRMSLVFGFLHVMPSFGLGHGR